MFSLIRELLSLLTPGQRKRLFRLQILVVFMAFGEMVGVASFGAFMALVGNPERLYADGAFAGVYRLSGMLSQQEFMFWAGAGLLLILVVVGLVSMYSVWRLSMYGAQIGAELSCRLYAHYMRQPWPFHSSGNSNELTKQIATESQRVTSSIISPLMEMNAKAVLALFMGGTIFVYDPVVALGAIGIFATLYFILYKTVRRRLGRKGEAISEAQTQRFRLMAEGFGGIKDVLVLQRQHTFTRQFERASQRFAHSFGSIQALSQMPRYAMEIFAFGAVIFLVLYLLAAHGGNLGSMLPALSIYALAGLKMLPAFQKMYASVSQIRGNLAAFGAIRGDLRASGETSPPAPDRVGRRLVPREAIRMENVVFRYPGKKEVALSNFSMSIPANQVVGLVGASGSGKSTAIDILLGLLEPTEGRVWIDDQPLTRHNKRAWQQALGFVPQSIFLSDSSIRDNIAFGLPPEAIDEDRVKRAATMAHLDELLAELPHGLGTRVGERGVQLSGGQRQRIGIARALYHDADVLVLDEATSALDGITEKLIMDAIHDFSGKKTIILIAHRLATVKQCDRIYLMNKGRIVDQGRYSDMIAQNAVFRRMAQHA